jgi:hypothetical protein
MSAGAFFGVDIRPGPHAHAVMVQLRDWPIGFIDQREIGGLLGYLLPVPVHLAAVAVAIYVAACGRHFDRWLRLTAGAALAQHVVAFFYGGATRYFFLTWFLTMLVVAVWCEQVAAPWIARRWPQLSARARRS